MKNPNPECPREDCKFTTYLDRCMKNKHSEKFFDYCIDVSRNNLLITELAKLKSIANEVLLEWKLGNEDNHKVNISYSCIQIEDDGEITLKVVIQGLGVPEYKNQLKDYLQKEVMKRWGLEVFVYYEQGY
jgi:hypothetical protein